MTDFAARTAGILLDIGAIHVWQGDKPFIFTSGWASPVYIDCRKLIGFLPERRAVTDMAVKELSRKVDLSAIDVIAGGETAGISYAAWVSDALDKPMVYVRKKPKDFGRGKQIEGYMKDGARVLLVEDLATDGASKVAFADALRAAGATIDHAFSVFFYDIYAESKSVLSEGRLSLHALCTWRDVIAVARARSIWDEKTLSAVEQFLADSAGWSVRHGGGASRKAAQG